jgi:hypothetical protein
MGFKEGLNHRQSFTTQVVKNDSPYGPRRLSVILVIALSIEFAPFACNSNFRQPMNPWHKIVPGFMHVVQYKGMVAEQDHETRRLLELCGLPWQDNCLQFHKSKRAIRTLAAV